MSSFPATFIRSSSVGFGFGFDGFCRERKVELGLARFVSERSKSFNCLIAPWAASSPFSVAVGLAFCVISLSFSSYRIFLSFIGCSE